MGRPRIESQFDDYVQRGDGCWLWSGKTDSNGYGMCGRERAHRVAWRRAYGPIPDGSLVCHHCDTPLCVRPDHLFLGTAADNNRDRHAKGRSRSTFPSGDDHPARRRRGERHWQAKLSTNDVAAIRARRAAGEMCRVIADDYGIHEATVSRIARSVWRQEVPA